MLEIVVSGVDGLVILVLPGEALDCPPKGSPNEQWIALGKLPKVRRLHLKFDSRRIFGDHRWKHLKQFTKAYREMHEINLGPTRDLRLVRRLF
jgi:hypothetical protein